MFKKLTIIVILFLSSAIAQNVDNLNTSYSTTGTGEIEVSKETMVFDTTDVGESDSDSLYIYNLGTGDLLIDSIYTDNDYFSVKSFKGMIGPLDSIIIQVTFLPVYYGNHSGYLTIISDDNDESYTYVELNGFGNDKIPKISTSDSILIFNETKIEYSDTLSLFLTNSGDTLLNIYNIYCNNQDFVPAFSDSNIVPGDSIILPIFFSPSRRGNITGRLSIRSNDPITRTLEIELKGAGVGPEISVHPSTVDFGVVSIGDTAVQIITISNTGEYDLKIDSLYFADDSLSAFFVNSIDSVLPPSSSMFIKIQYSYKKQLSNVFEDILIIESNDPITPIKNVNLIAKTYRRFYVPGDFSTIQSGIDSIWSGDSLIIAPDTYKETIIVENKSIVLGSNYLITGDTTYISNTILEGDGNNSILCLKNVEDSTSTISGFTITNGGGESGGGINLYNSTLKLVNLRILANKANRGGAILSDKSNVKIYDVIIDNNQAFDGGGIHCESSTLNLRNVTITNNKVGEYGNGGGIGCFYKNTLNIEQCTISKNSAGDTGGGLYIESPSTLYFKDEIFSGNRAEVHGGAVRAIDQSQIHIENVLFTNNYCDWEGGAVSCEMDIELSLENIIMYNNSAKYGGGAIVCSDSDIELINVTISKNSAYTGGGLLFYGGSNPILFNSIIYDNSPSKIDFINVWGAEITVVSSDIQGGINGIAHNNDGIINWLSGNINANPLFLNSTSGDFSLKDNSPCIGSGKTSTQIEQINYYAPTYDYLNNIRPNPIGSNPDMGAIENLKGVPTKIIDQLSDIPTEFALYQNYPNPFNPLTKIQFTLPQKGNVVISIYDNLGQLVEVLFEGTKQIGYHEVSFNGSNFSSGVYFYVIKVSNSISNKEIYSASKKMCLIK
jgi:hypothetical protein